MTTLRYDIYGQFLDSCYFLRILRIIMRSITVILLTFSLLASTPAQAGWWDDIIRWFSGDGNKLIRHQPELGWE